MRSIEVKKMDGTVVTVNEIKYGKWRETRESSDEFDNEVALIVACSGLTVEEIDDLDAPDFNSIRDAAIDVNNPAYVPAKATTEIKLSEEVFTIMGESTCDITIHMPKVKVLRELKKIKGANPRVDFMIKAATHIADLDSLCMSDYSLLVVSVPDFFGQKADYFQPTK